MQARVTRWHQATSLASVTCMTNPGAAPRGLSKSAPCQIDSGLLGVGIGSTESSPPGAFSARPPHVSSESALAVYKPNTGNGTNEMSRPCGQGGCGLRTAQLVLGLSLRETSRASHPSPSVGLPCPWVSSWDQVSLLSPDLPSPISA